MKKRRTRTQEEPQQEIDNFVPDPNVIAQFKSVYFNNFKEYRHFVNEHAAEIILYTYHVIATCTDTEYLEFHKTLKNDMARFQLHRATRVDGQIKFLIPLLVKSIFQSEKKEEEDPLDRHKCYCSIISQCAYLGTSSQQFIKQQVEIVLNYLLQCIEGGDANISKKHVYIVSHMLKRSVFDLKPKQILFLINKFDTSRDVCLKLLSSDLDFSVLNHAQQLNFYQKLETLLPTIDSMHYSRLFQILESLTVLLHIVPSALVLDFVFKVALQQGNQKIKHSASILLSSEVIAPSLMPFIDKFV